MFFVFSHTSSQAPHLVQPSLAYTTSRPGHPVLRRSEVSSSSVSPTSITPIHHCRNMLFCCQDSVHATVIHAAALPYHTPSVVSDQCGARLPLDELYRSITCITTVAHHTCICYTAVRYSRLSSSQRPGQHCLYAESCQQWSCTTGLALLVLHEHRIGNITVFLHHQTQHQHSMKLRKLVHSGKTKSKAARAQANSTRMATHGATVPEESDQFLVAQWTSLNELRGLVNLLVGRLPKDRRKRQKPTKQLKVCKQGLHKLCAQHSAGALFLLSSSQAVELKAARELTLCYLTSCTPPHSLPATLPHPFAPQIYPPQSDFTISASSGVRVDRLKYCVSHLLSTAVQRQPIQLSKHY